MKRVVLSIAAVVVLASLPAIAAAQQPDEFELWNGFGEGSSVSAESVMDMGKMKSTTKIKSTLKKKEADKITLAVEIETNGKTMASERVIERGKKAAECPACKKAHKESVVKESGTEKVKIGDQEVDAKVLEVTSYGCADKETPMKLWTSKEVPGSMVKSEMKTSHGTINYSVTAFEKK